MERAVILGGSMAGLLAARVLADHAREVLVLERDVLPAGPAHRKGVPQARHSHVLLTSGRRVLERLLPGALAEVVAGGAVEGDPLLEGRRHVGGGYHAQAPSTMRTLLASRPLLEDAVRRHVRAHPGVRFLECTDVRGLEATEDGARVTGALVERDGAAETIAADLVVDATGRGSRAPQWLAALGMPVPSEERVACNVGYASRHFRHAEGQVNGLKIVICAPVPGRLRGGVMARQEGGRWVMTLVGLKGERPLADPEDFAAFARSLPAGEFGEVATQAEPLDAPVTAHYPCNVRRRYDRLERLPERFIVIGDAACTFNPMYGQGMSVAALEATALEAALAEGGLDDLGPRFFARAAPHLETPWLFAAGNDLRLTQPGAPVSLGTRAVRWYMDRLHRTARRDPQVAAAFLRVSGLTAPLGSLFAPGVAARVLAGRG